MKIKKRVLFTALALMCAFVCAWSVFAGDIVPEKNIKSHKIVRLHYLGGINPSDTAVDAGTTVIWINDARAAIEIQFEGKQVTMACKSPVHFVVDENGSFISDRIPQGSVASLCFVEKGEYTYVARKAASGSGGATYQQRENIKEFKGKVTVK